MAIFTLDELKGFCDIETSVTTEDTVLGFARLSADSEVKRFTGRVFDDAGSVSARKFVPTNSLECITDDFSTTTGLIITTDEDGDGTYETTWTTADYELHPLDGLLNGETWSYCRIEAVGTSVYFPTCTTRSASVKVTARWGWAAVPAPVKMAGLILAASDERVRALVRGEGGFTQWSRSHAYELLGPFVHPLAVRVG